MNTTTRQFLSRHALFEKRYARLFNRALRDQILSYPNINTEPMERVYRQMYLTISRQESKIAWNAYVLPINGKRVKDMTDMVAETTAPQDPDLLPAFWVNLMNQYLNIYLATRINSVTNTTIKQIEALGLSPDLTESELRRALQGHARVQQLRANTIARTETTNAMNKSQILALESSGLKFEKQWRSVRDDRVRETHSHADFMNDWIPISEYFLVGSSYLLFPGDSTNGAEKKETIGCRCYLIYREIASNVGFRPIR